MSFLLRSSFAPLPLRWSKFFFRLRLRALSSAHELPMPHRQHRISLLRLYPPPLGPFLGRCVAHRIKVMRRRKFTSGWHVGQDGVTTVAVQWPSSGRPSGRHSGRHSGRQQKIGKSVDLHILKRRIHSFSFLKYANPQFSPLFPHDHCDGHWTATGRPL